MKNIVIVYDGTSYTYRWIKTFLWVKKEFLERGYRINYISPMAMLPLRGLADNQIEKAHNIKSIDILLIAYHHSTSSITNQSQTETISILQKLRNRCERIVWLDTADSTGTTQFEVLPYVDVYLKKQILNDLTLYELHHYGMRYYINYYHKKFNLDDPLIDKDYTLLDKQYANKVRVSFNVGMGDIWERVRSVILRPYSIRRPKLNPVGIGRETDIFFNGTIKYSELVSYQRRKTCELISNDKKRNHPNPYEKMSHEDYISYMKNTKTVVSPFGWGEVCYRDFEAIMFGATLLKPSMDHLLTYPNFYIAGETYVPLNWDFSNYEDVASQIGCKEFDRIAQNAQELYYFHTETKEGKESFVNHIIDAIEK